MACRTGHTETVALLLEDGKLDFNASNKWGDTAFMLACQEGKADVVKLLLDDDRIDCEAKDNNGKTAFMWACIWGEADIVKLILTQQQLLNSPTAEITLRLNSIIG